MKRRNIRSAVPGNKPNSTNVGSLNSDRFSQNETVTSLGRFRNRVNSLNQGYMTSCRAIVMNQRRASRPKPGPIPAPLTILECKANKRNIKLGLLTTKNSEAELDMFSNIQVSNLFDGTTSRGRTTMATLPSVRGQVLPTPKFQFKRHESPTDNRMKNSFVIQNHNKSFEQYRQNMRKKRLKPSSTNLNQTI